MSEPNRPKKRSCIYVTPTTLSLFQNICIREGTNVSLKLEDFMNRYNMAHTPGNPQLTIANYVKPDEPQPMRVLCLYIKGAMTDGRVFCRTSDMWIPGIRCYSCPKNMLRKDA